MKTRIRITSTPSGQAPLEIREKWIGVEIPLISPIDPVVGHKPTKGVQRGVLGGEPDKKNLGGYEVSGAIAIDCLREIAPDAASWWEEYVPSVLHADLVFGRDCCELLD